MANRGAVAARILRAARTLGLPSVAVYSDADAGAPYLASANDSVRIGPGPARQSYLDQDALLAAMHQSGCDALHPGYGFLAEHAGFAQRVIDAGATFVGPSPRWIEAMGHKTRARATMAAQGMPMAAGSTVLNDDPDEARAAAHAIGYPVLVKPAGGGGGIGMIDADNDDELVAALERARSLALRSFGTGDVYLEKLVERPRHIEFQIVADRHGDVRHLFERDCSVQRRHQKLIEEASAPLLERSVVDAMAAQVAAIIRALGYDSIGTVEMLWSPARGFTFLEMNTRLQVEHAVTETITGVDIVATQIRAAAGEHLADFLPPTIARDGHAVEARVCAEDPWSHFPSPGVLTVFEPPTGEGLRVDTGYAAGRSVTPYYDSLLAKVIAHAPTRIAAIDKLAAALQRFAIQGVKTNLLLLQAVLQSAAFRAGTPDTQLVADVVAKHKGLNHG